MKVGSTFESLYAIQPKVNLRKSNKLFLSTASQLLGAALRIYLVHMLRSYMTTTLP